MGEQVAAGSWGLSSVGRAPALQAGGREFESLSLHESNEASRWQIEHEPLDRACTKRAAYARDAGYSKNTRDEINAKRL